MDLAPGLGPIDVGILGRTPAFVTRLTVILLDARRFSGLHQINRFEHGLDPHREQAVEIDAAERVVGADRCLLLQQDVAGIEPIIGPEN